MKKRHVIIDLSDRDRKVLQYIARFKQLSTNHIYKLAFSDLASKTPCDRALSRLTERGYLIRIERRIVGGSRGGSGQYVYQLGSRGHYMFFEARHRPIRVINYHTIAIADLYLLIRDMEQAGELEIVGLSTEPDCWMKIGHADLRPDLRLDIRMTDGRVLKLWIEVDMATEGQRQIKEKIERYWYAYNNADHETLPVFPLVLVLAIDEERKRELAWILSQYPPDYLDIFRFGTLTDFRGALAVEK